MSEARRATVLWLGMLRGGEWETAPRYHRVVRVVEARGESVAIEVLGVDALGLEKWDLVTLPGQRVLALEAAAVSLHATATAEIESLRRDMARALPEEP